MKVVDRDATGNKEHMSMSGDCRPLPSKPSKVPFEPLISSTEESSDTLPDDALDLLSSVTEIPIGRFMPSTEGSEQDKLDLEEFYERKNRVLTKSFNKNMRKFKLRMLWIKYKKLLNIAIPSYAIIVLCLLAVNVYVPVGQIMLCAIIVNVWVGWEIVKLIRRKYGN